MIERLDIGVGDSAYVLGRFLSQEGEYKNIPICRFGNIAMTPDEPLYLGNNKI